MKDKATVEMECMEDGYLAKIIRGDGEKEIKVGEVLILLYIIFSFPLTFTREKDRLPCCAIVIRGGNDCH